MVSGPVAREWEGRRYLDDDPDVIGGKAVSQDALDEEAHNFQVYECLERLREVGPGQAEELCLQIGGFL